jgi:hypothetical protein
LQEEARSAMAAGSVYTHAPVGGRPPLSCSRAPRPARRREDHGRGDTGGADRGSGRAERGRGGGGGEIRWGGEWRGGAGGGEHTFLVSSLFFFAHPLSLCPASFCIDVVAGAGFSFSLLCTSGCLRRVRAWGFSLSYSAAAADVSAAIKSGSPRAPYESAGLVVGLAPPPRLLLRSRGRAAPSA